MLPSRQSYCAVTIAGLFLVSTTALAQTGADSITPRAGSWGAETGFNSGAALLYFSSPTAAWLLRANFAVGSQTQDVTLFPSGITSETNATGALSLEAGRRWWSGEPSARLRPLTGLGLSAQYSAAGDNHGAGVGAYGEFGATYFFSPHVSLGAVGELDLGYFSNRYANGTTSLKSHSWQASGNLAHVTASVYF